MAAFAAGARLHPVSSKLREAPFLRVPYENPISSLFAKGARPAPLHEPRGALYDPFMGALSPPLRAWIVPGLAGVVAVVDADGMPRLARIWAVRAPDDGDLLEVYVQASSARGLLDALDRPRRAALNLIEVTTYRSRAFKGACERSLRDPDPAVIEESIAAFVRAFQSVGMSADSPQRMLAQGGGTEMAVLRLAVESVFDQSPKPGAGARL